MIEKLREHIVARAGTNLVSLDLVLEAFRPMEVKKNEVLLEMGKRCTQVFFIVEGCLQLFTYDAEMNETTRDVMIEDNWCSELTSFTTGKPAIETIRALEPSKLLVIEKPDFERLVKTVPPFEMFYRQVLEASYLNSVYRLNTFVSLSAVERMKWLYENRPQLLTRVSSKVLASYLGINKDVYSRLKSKM